MGYITPLWLCGVEGARLLESMTMVESLLKSPEVLEVTNMVKLPLSLEQRTGKTQLYLINN